jgi:hypothetical protein
MSRKKQLNLMILRSQNLSSMTGHTTQVDLRSRPMLLGALPLEVR